MGCDHRVFGVQVGGWKVGLMGTPGAAQVSVPPTQASSSHLPTKSKPKPSALPPFCRAAQQVSLGPGVHEGRPLTVQQKLEACNATERARIAFGKSGIHGWGLFARLPMKQDSMVAEYK